MLHHQDQIKESKHRADSPQDQDNIDLEELRHIADSPLAFKAIAKAVNLKR